MSILRHTPFLFLSILTVACGEQRPTNPAMDLAEGTILASFLVDVTYQVDTWPGSRVGETVTSTWAIVVSSSGEYSLQIEGYDDKIPGQVIEHDSLNEAAEERFTYPLLFQGEPIDTVVTASGGTFYYFLVSNAHQRCGGRSSHFSVILHVDSKGVAQGFGETIHQICSDASAHFTSHVQISGEEL